MNTLPGLSALTAPKGGAVPPRYPPEAHGTGIVHLGVGAFHRAHQALYTDEALAAEGGDWRIVGVSLRSTDIADRLNPQNGRYTLLERGTNGTSARIVGALDHVLAGPRDGAAILAALVAPTTRIVSLTVTEKAYGINRTTFAADATHPSVAADLATPRHAVGVLGLITEALRLRRANGTAPFTVMSCDNLPSNGALLRGGVVDFAQRVEPELSRWIADTVRFPSTMVDRITPAPSTLTFSDAEKLTGCRDLAAVESEQFSQWVIEDQFSNERPTWEAGGAIFVSDVQPYELMKLRMLNGAHSMLAYVGALSGCEYVRDVMARTDLASLVDRHMQAAQATLPVLAAVDLDEYRSELLMRFGNTAIAHRTEQIAMDGTEKLPQRLLAPAIETLAQDGDISAYAFAVAGWMRYCIGGNNASGNHALNDPREADIRSALAGTANAEAISTQLHDLPNLFPSELKDNPTWRLAVATKLHVMLTDGIDAAINAEVTSMPN